MSTRFTYANAASKANGKGQKGKERQTVGSSSSQQQQQSGPVQQEQEQEQVPPPPSPQEQPWRAAPLNTKGTAKSKAKAKIARLQASSVLRDKFVPKHLKAINYASVSYRWVLGTNRHIHQVGFGIIEGPGSPSDGSTGSANPSSAADDMDLILAQMAENFIPRVPCMCGSGPQPMHGPYYYAPFPVHRVPPDYHFALRDDGQSKPVNQADLDETTSITEYASTFRDAIRLEHEEKMRLYEKYSLYKWPLKRFAKDADKASIYVEGIADARPGIQVGDIVLLRPIQPLVMWVPQLPQFGRPGVQAQQYTIEIESRLVTIQKGKGSAPDLLVIEWNLTEAQQQELRDHGWVREYTIRFIPNGSIIDRSLTSLDWLQNLTEFQQQAMKEILFPVNAPIVKPLTPEQRKVYVGVPKDSGYSSQQDNGDIGKPLNELQSSFVRMVRARTLDPSFLVTRPPVILTGPAGTGKTKTLIYAIADVLGLLKNGQNANASEVQEKNTNRVLLCCPSHAASDVLTRRLAALLKRTEIFRLYDASRPSATVPGHILPFTCQVPGSDGFTLPPPQVWTGLKVVVCTCMDAHLLFRAQITNHAVRAKQQCFKTFILSESNPLGLSFGQVTANENPFFTHLFIDEAAQATEPEILCPISCCVDPHFGGRKVEIALVGDPRQLSPRVFANNVADNLGRSFMERLLRRPVTCLGGGEESLLGSDTKSDSLLDNAGSLSDLIRYYANIDGQEHLTIFLSENYRGHPSFLMMPSSFFYFDRLRSAKTLNLSENQYWLDLLHKVEALTTPMSVSIETPGDNSPIPERMFAQIHHQRWPIHFRGVKGEDKSVAISNYSGTDSWQNASEAFTVVEIIDTLIKNGVQSRRIGVMTPFRGQVILIRELLRAKYHYDVNVGTIENYQAVEQDVIVLSLTRSNGDFVENDISKRMGIFGQPKQANVAMTRAENLFIVVGNPDVMFRHKLWRQWLRFCFRNGLWHGLGLKEWDDLLLGGMKFVSTLDMNQKIDDDNNALVVSTLEKIHRVHRM